MDVVSAGPLRVASLLWQPRAGLFTLTVVAKATLRLLPGESQLAAEQDPPNEEDNHWNDDPSRSLYSPCDLVPFKPRADVLLVGNAFAPGREPVRSLLVRIVAGTVDKSIEIFGERTFTHDGQLREGPRFVKMPLRYERAAGGPDTANPVGLWIDAPQGTSRSPALPNLQPPGLVLERPTDFVAPTGFGPIAPSWPERREKLRRHAGAWPGRDWASRPLPEDIDPGYFNAAPRDQQLDALRDNERIVLENLHPEHPRLVTSLPGLRPRAKVERRGEPPEELPMRADTLWIDTDRGLCTVTWRGQLRLADRADTRRVTIGAEQGGRPLAAPRGGDTVVADDAAKTMLAVPQARSTLPFVGGPPEDSPMARAASGDGDIEEISVDEVITGAFPAVAGGQPQTLLLSPAMAAAGTTLPFKAPGAQAVAPPPNVATPPPVQPPVAVEPIAPPAAPSRWAGSADARARSIGEQAVAPPSSPNMIAPGGGPSGVAAGVLGLSNDAAGQKPWKPEPREQAQAPVEPRPRAAPREVIKLIWFDEKVAPRLRRPLEWRRILLESDLAPAAEEDDGMEEESDEARNRRHVFEVLARAQPIDALGVREALAGAARADGKFEPPLVLVAGELQFPFDELETLKATVTAVTPLMVGDAKLKELVDAVNELLKTPWLEGSGPLADGLTRQVKDAFGQGKRILSAEQLAAHVERILLQRRAYQKRTVFGQACIRSLLAAPGAGDGIPTYLPEALGKDLPMVQRLRARLLAEVDTRQEEHESHPAALRVVGVGRSLMSV